MQKNQNNLSMNQGQGGDKGKSKGETRKLADVKREFLEEVQKAKKNLIDGNTEAALDFAFKALMEHKEDLGGEGSILLLPALFILAEGNIVENKLKKAEEFLIAAYWNFLKYGKGEDDEEEEDKKEDQQVDEQDIMSYRGTLHKTFSKLYLAQGEFEKALDELKASIYMDSTKYGANHIITALNYFQMGNIFIQKNSIQEGEAFYGKTAELFYKYFKYFFRQEQQNYEQGIENNYEDIDAMVIQEAYEQQSNILGYFMEKYPADEEKRIIQKPIIDSQRALALMYKYPGGDRDIQKYQQYIQQAYYECMQHKGEEHPKTLRLKQMASNVEQEEDYQQQGDYDQQQQYDQQQYYEQQDSQM